MSTDSSQTQPLPAGINSIKIFVHLYSINGNMTYTHTLRYDHVILDATFIRSQSYHERSQHDFGQSTLGHFFVRKATGHLVLTSAESSPKGPTLFPFMRVHCDKLITNSGPSAPERERPSARTQDRQKGEGSSKNKTVLIEHISASFTTFFKSGELTQDLTTRTFLYQSQCQRKYLLKIWVLIIRPFYPVVNNISISLISESLVYILYRIHSSSSHRCARYQHCNVLNNINRKFASVSQNYSMRFYENKVMEFYSSLVPHSYESNASLFIASRYKVDLSQKIRSVAKEKKGKETTLICPGRKVDKHLFLLTPNIFQAVCALRGMPSISVPLVAGLMTSTERGYVAVIDYNYDIIVDKFLYYRMLLLVFRMLRK